MVFFQLYCINLWCCFSCTALIHQSVFIVVRAIVISTTASTSLSYRFGYSSIYNLEKIYMLKLCLLVKIVFTRISRCKCLKCCNVWRHSDKFTELARSGQALFKFHNVAVSCNNRVLFYFFWFSGKVWSEFLEVDLWRELMKNLGQGHLYRAFIIWRKHCVRTMLNTTDPWRACNSSFSLK